MTCCICGKDENCNCVKCKYIQGDRGDRGDKGDKGDKGDTGPKGYKGYEGPMGPQGDKGDAGEDGETGEKGLKGNKGAPGVKGPQGPQGEIGNRGLRGEAGPRGVKGPIGLPGDRGPMGDMGETGDIGDAGLEGIQGAPGFKGSQGLKGADGDRGPKGDRGPQGIRGATGLEGRKGDQGDFGDRGVQGIPGEKGIYGPPGQTIAPPNEVILAKVADFLATRTFSCYMEVDNPTILNARGIGRLANSDRIEKANLSYIETEGGIVIPIRNVESINIPFSVQDTSIRDGVLLSIRNLFSSFEDCLKASPDSVNIDENGETISTGDENFDFEYTTKCVCEGECRCIGNKIDVCKYSATRLEGVKKTIQKLIGRGKEIERILTSRPNFVDPNIVTTGISVEDVCFGAVLLAYRVQVNINQNFLMLSVVSLDKIMAIKYR